MKHSVQIFHRFFICLLFFFLNSNVLFAQGGYACLPHPGTINWFTNNQNYLRGIRIDSVKVSGSDTVFYPYHTKRYTRDNRTDDSGGSWLGKVVVQKSDGTFLFNNAYGDTIVIKTQAGLGGSWTMYGDSSFTFYIGTVTAVDTMTVLGALDSVKIIEINAYNPVPVLDDFLNNTHITISKAHGFVRALDLYNFPYHGATDTISDPYFSLFDSSGQFFNLVPFHIPTNKELYDYQPGDAFAYYTMSDCQCSTGESIGLREYDSVLSRVDVDPAHVKLAIFKIQDGYDLPCYYPDSMKHSKGAYKTVDTIIIDSNPAFGMQLMPEESGQHHQYHYYPDTMNCVSGPLTTMSEIFLFEGCDEHAAWKPGLGTLDTAYCIAPCMDAVSGWSSEVERRQYYVHKGTIICGNADLSVTNIAMGGNALAIVPNPANGFVSLTSGNNGLSREYIICNAVGEAIRTITTTRDKITLDVSNWPAGMYIVSMVLSDGSRINTKMLITH